MHCTEVAPHIFHIDFPTQVELTSTFLRFQEHYESPEFKGKIFSLEEYKKWYIANSPEGKKTGKFTYYTDWRGFNIPSNILEPFFEGKFDPLSEKEQQLLALFKDKRRTKCYIIGTFGGTKDTLKHEIAHGLFYTNPTYKKEILSALKTINPELIQQLHHYFEESGGYHPDVWDDELHAHLIASVDKLVAKGVFSRERVHPEHEKLKSVFERYYLGTVSK